MANQNMGCQTIGCSVNSCQYHDAQQSMCTLSNIRVEPNSRCRSGNCDESMCGSYRHK